MMMMTMCSNRYATMKIKKNPTNLLTRRAITLLPADKLHGRKQKYFIFPDFHGLRSVFLS